MKYWMKFYNNDNKLMLSISSLTFMGDDLDFSQFKSRFNNDFVKGTAKAVSMSFLGNGVMKNFIAGFRGDRIYIVDTDTKQEYSVREFSEQLNVIEDILKPKEVHLLS